MKKIIKVTLMLFILFIVFVFFSIPSYAATGFEGYAIYHDDVFNFFPDFHAGLMNEAHPKINNPVIHVSSSLSGVVKIDSWSNFLSNEDFQGYYSPSSGITSSGRDLVMATANYLKTQNISYTLSKQIDYPHLFIPGYVRPFDITHMRCDGLVEYCYEYNGYRIFGSDEYWNISTRGSNYKDEHSISNVTPKVQASYMTKWTPTNKTLYLVNANSAKVLDVPNGNSANGTDLIQYSYNGASNQKFKLTYTSADASYSFIPVIAQNSAIEITNTSNANGAIVQIWQKPASNYMNSQKFRLTQNADGSYRIHSYASGYNKVVVVQGASMNNDAAIIQWDNNGSTNGHWFFVQA